MTAPHTFPPQTFGGGGSSPLIVRNLFDSPGAADTIVSGFSDSPSGDITAWPNGTPNFDDYRFLIAIMGIRVRSSRSGLNITETANVCLPVPAGNGQAYTYINMGNSGASVQIGRNGNYFLTGHHSAIGSTHYISVEYLAFYP